MKNCELTEAELVTTNGCGSSHWALILFRIPKWVSKAFTRCCNFHDIDYQYQTGKADADDNLKNCMYYNAFHSPWYQKWVKLIIADLVYIAVTSKASNWAYNVFKVEK